MTSTLHFNGRSADNFVIPSLVQFLSLLSKTGELSFWLSANLRANMYMYDGQLTHTELGRLGGMDVIGHMFCWEYGKGFFEFQSEVGGDKLLYRSLGVANPNQILMRVMQRIDECPFRERLHRYLNDDIHTQIAWLDPFQDFEKLEAGERLVYNLLQRKGSATAAELLSSISESEFTACGVFQKLIDNRMIGKAKGADSIVPYHEFVNVMNIISQYSDRSLALTLLRERRKEIGMISDDKIMIRQLRTLGYLARNELARMMPNNVQRWQEMNQLVQGYADELADRFG